MPGIESVPVVEPASVHPVESVTVATLPFTKSFAAGQLVPNPLKITDCPVARTKFGLKTTLTVFDGAKAPDDEVVKLTVQVEVVLAAVDPGEKVALVGADANAAPADKLAIRPPSAAAPTIALTTRLVRRCS
jgi:hypothetical protein